jgi:hypothetical protein
MERLLVLLDRSVNSRTAVTLTLLWTLQFPQIRNVLKRAAFAGLVGVAIVLNFGLDMEFARQRRRQLVPGTSRFLIVALAVALFRTRWRARLFWIGVLLRVGPSCSLKAAELMFAILSRLRGPHKLLAGSGRSALRFGDDSSCAICLDETLPDWT